MFKKTSAYSIINTECNKPPNCNITCYYCGGLVFVLVKLFTICRKVPTPRSIYTVVNALRNTSYESYGLYYTNPIKINIHGTLYRGILHFCFSFFVGVCKLLYTSLYRKGTLRHS